MNIVDEQERKWRFQYDTMTNSKGEWVYTTSEIGNMLGIAAGTIRAIGKRLYGVTHYQFTLDEARVIKDYIDSTSPIEDAKRLAALSNALGVTRKTDESEA